MPENSNVHEGHKKRVRNTFLDVSLENMPPHQALELILSTCLVRKDTNITAHLLLDTFGSISSVFDAPIDDLIKVDGIGEKTACFLKMIPQICSLYMYDKSNIYGTITTTTDAAELLKSKFIGLTSEVICCILMDRLGKVLYCGKVSKGQSKFVSFDLKELFAIIGKYNVYSIIIAHNHPSGIALPSIADIDSTQTLATTLKNMGIQLKDHLLFANNDWISFKESGIADW